MSLFVDADHAQIDAAKHCAADIVELHTGTYCDAGEDDRPALLEAIRKAAEYAASVGLEVHAGHGLDYTTVQPVAAIPQVVELNIGHFLVAEAVMVGLPAAITQMRAIMDAAR